MINILFCGYRDWSHNLFMNVRGDGCKQIHG